jgi:hypothetical protein
VNRPKDLWEFYELLRLIERRLDEIGESEWANRLRGAVNGGATSGEILDRVAMELRHLDAAGLPASSGIGIELLIAGQFIDEALGSK